MDLSRLATLKEKLVTAREFSKVFDYFLDHFGENPDFIALGERADCPFLEAVLAQVGHTLFQRKVWVTEMLLTELPEQHFIHGTCRIAGRLATVIYFDDIHTGLMVVILSESPSETRLVRFSGRPMPTGSGPSLN
jgi:hypothetical protein